MGGECKFYRSPYAYEQFAHFTSSQGHELTVTPGGYHISNKEQRDHSIAFLRRVQDVMGFSTQPTIALLQSQWMDLD